MIERFESWQHFVNECEKLSKGGYRHTVKGEDKWHGSLSYAGALKLARTGDESTVASAEKLLDSLAQVDMGAEVTQWLPAQAGAYPCVPEYLSGSPTCMRRIAPTGDISPINIYVSTTCSAEMSAKQMQSRGVTILALLLKLQQIRPVELFLFAEMHGNTDGSYFEVIPVDSKPLSIAHAAFGLTHVGFARRLTYTMGEARAGFNGAWPKGYKYGDWNPKSEYNQRVAAAIGLTEQDLFIHSAHVQDKLILDPVAWVNEQVTRYNRQEGD